MKNKSRYKALLVTILVLSITCIIPFAAEYTEPEATLLSDPLQVRANGILVSFPDAQPFIDVNNRTLIPVRFATEAVGAEVSWDPILNIATIKKNGIMVQVTIGSNELKVTKDGLQSTVTMDTEAIMSGDRTFVPIRFVAEALGAWVGFSDLHNTVQIYQDKLTPAEIDRLHGYYDMSFVEVCKADGSYDSYIRAGYKMTDDQKLLTTYGGTYGMNNANEETFYNTRTLSSIAQPITDYVTKTRIAPDTNSNEDYVAAFARNSTGVINHMVEWGNEGKVTVNFKTDSSCVYHSKCQNSIYVRGVCTITFASDYDVSKLADNVKAGAFPFMPEPGKTYTFDAEFPVDYSGGMLWTAKVISLETRKVVKLY